MFRTFQWLSRLPYPVSKDFVTTNAISSVKKKGKLTKKETRELVKHTKLCMFCYLPYEPGWLLRLDEPMPFKQLIEPLGILC